MRTSISKVVAVAFLFVMAPFAENAFPSEEIHWSYNGPGGPENWGDIKSEFSTCKTGERQSPIDITIGEKVDLHGIHVDYKPARLDIVNNGHTIQVNYSEGSFIEINGKRYNLLQFHFHSPSEHKVSGKDFPLEAHLVHKGEEGLAVIGVFLTEGKENTFLKDVWKHLPKKGGDKHALDEVKIDTSKFLPEDRSYVHYYGSLTTPPCSEGVKWMVLNQTIEVSKAQIEQFRQIIHGNARPVQPHKGRIIEAKK